MTQVYMVSAGAVLLLASQSALAQQVAPTRGELERVPVQQPANAPRISVKSRGFEAGPCPLTESNLKASLNEVRFTGPGGASLNPAIQTLLSGIAPKSGEQPIAAICELRDVAQERLRTARFVASVQVPQQRLENGVLQLEVVTGRISEMRVTGDAGPYQELLKGRIAALKALDPLNEAEAEKILLLSNDIPGLTVKLGLSPAGGRPGDLVGDLQITYLPFRLLANVQNYNASFFGRWSGLLHGEFYGLTRLGDVTSITTQVSVDPVRQKIGQLRHSMLLDGAGTTLALRGTAAYSRPDLGTLDLRTLSLIGGVEVSRPLVRSLNRNAYIAGGFEIASQRTKVFSAAGSSPLNLDRVSQLYLRLSGDTRKLRFDGSSIASLKADVEVRQGLDFFGATKLRTVSGGYTPSRNDGSAIATIVRGGLEGSVSPTSMVELVGRLRGQWANRPLLNYDEYAIGNQTVGRGYDPGANTGDRAVGATVEPRINFDLRKLGSAQMFGYYDVVKLWNLDLGSSEAKRTIRSVGGGLRLTLSSGIRAELTYTHPLDPPLLTGQNIRPPADRVLFSLTMQLVPFGF